MIPAGIYLAGLAINCNYAFRYAYTTVADTLREYELYTLIIETGKLQLETGARGLASSSLTATYFPAMIQRLTGIEPLLLFKLYACFLIPFLPVIVYYIIKRLSNPAYALMGSLFVMAQVPFLQAPSMVRTNTGIIFFAMSVLVLLQGRIKTGWKIALLCLCATGMVVSHYTTTYIALITLIIVLVASQHRLLINCRLYWQKGLITLCLALVIGICIWHIGIVERAWEGAKIVTKQVQKDIISDSEYGILDIESRDKITQAAFGVKNPDGDHIFRFRWVALAFGWLTIIILLYGLVASLKVQPIEYVLLAAGLLLMIGATLALPSLSRSYGVMRVYFQALPVLALFYPVGITKVAGYIRLKPVILYLLITIPYGYYMYTTGLIHSITGGGL